MWKISYWVLPLISGLAWLGTLMSLLIYWNVDGQPQYPSMTDQGTQNLAYISDIGAYELKPLFVTGSIITSLFFSASLTAERFLRHRGRLAKNIDRREKVYSGLSIGFAFVGAVGLGCLSGFDTFRYQRLHFAFLFIFLVGMIASASFSCAQYRRLGKNFIEHTYLRQSFWIKLAFIIIELCLAVAFIICLVAIDGSSDVAAVLEWILAFGFSFFIFSYIFDLAPAVRTRGKAEGIDLENKPATERESADPMVGV